MKSTLNSVMENITPTLAARYLETSCGNRPMSQIDIDGFANQMRAGLWRETPQGIIFDREGHLVDGHHRLWAVFESGVTVPMMVARGLDPEAVTALDKGKRRSYRDDAYFAGWECTDPQAASVARLLVLGIGGRSRRVPTDVVHKWYMHYQSQIDLACRIRQHTRGAGTNVIPVPVAAPFARAAFSLNVELLERMGSILRTGVIETNADRAAIALRDAWLTKRLGTEAEAYQKAEAAIRAFAERRPIKNLQRAESELFEIPKLPVALRYEMKFLNAAKAVPKNVAAGARREEAARV